MNEDRPFTGAFSKQFADFMRLLGWAATLGAVYFLWKRLR